MVMVIMGLAMMGAPISQAAQPPAGGNFTTFVIPIEGTIDNGNLMFIERAYRDALNAGAGAIIFEINTYGGFVDAAISIKDLILHSPVPTYTFVNTRALSAGALIALAGENLIMASGATMGAAEPQIFGERVDAKAMSMWVGQLYGAAEARGRNGQVAAAMADSDIVIEGLTEEGHLVTLTPLLAEEWGMVDNIFDTRHELLRYYGLDGPVVVASRTTQEHIAGWLSNPFVSSLLLVIGIAGIVIEIFTAGSFGIFGAVGIIGFVLYFMGNFMVGNIGMGAILLFGAGILLIAIEIFVLPGFGVVGIAGVLAILASLLMAAPTITQGVVTLAASLVVAALIIIITLKNKKTRKVWGRLALSYTEQGYSSSEEKMADYLGQRGTAVTVLRPAGTAQIDGQRIDVVTGGEFINPGAALEVILVEGARIVVREIDSKQDLPTGSE